MLDADFLALMQRKFPRYVWIGKASGQVRLKGPAWDAVREFVWRREEGLCQDCGRPTILEKGFWQSCHCAHIKSKGSGGSDLPSNLRNYCMESHMKEHSGEMARAKLKTA